MTTIPIAAPHDGQHVAAQVGDVLDVVLAETAGSGFQWRLAGPPAGCAVAGETRIPGDVKHPGQPGSHRWQVVVGAAGKHTLTFALGRGWEDDSRQRVAITVTVN
ncbi:MAG: protease inhibitor I42 family protein [Planctomycetes bacterium]|nr:protease inhibitor I42 family protein [Planctomycetota bacterium]